MTGNWITANRKLEISVTAGTTNQTACQRSHDLFLSPPVVCDNNIFHLFCFTQQVGNNTFHTQLVVMPG